MPYNRPLDFELKNLITDHPFIKERGISDEMIVKFGLGIATRGIMKDRLVFPIHNKDGKLVAYCGRSTANEFTDDNPKYKQPPNFRKDLELFNLHRVIDDGHDGSVIMVESFFSVIHLEDMGYHAVSPMGRSLSRAQIELLKDANIAQVCLLFDGDDPGRAAVTTVGRALLEAGFEVTAPVVPEDFKPHRCNKVVISQTLG